MRQRDSGSKIGRDGEEAAVLRQFFELHHDETSRVVASFGRLLMEKSDYDQAEKYLRISLEANARNDFYREKIKAQLEELARKKAGR